MSANKILNSLDRSWDRDDILLKIKKGLGTDEIVNDFLSLNGGQIKELNSLLKPEDIDLLNQVEQLSTCESNLINKIRNLYYLERGKNVSDEVINLTKVKAKSNSRKIVEKGTINYFPNRLIRKS